MNIPEEFFTMQSFLTLSSASAIVFIVTSVIGYVSNGKLNLKWLSSLIAEIVGIIGVFLKSPVSILNIFIGILNGMLIYATAVGINTVVVPVTREGQVNQVKSNEFKQMANAGGKKPIVARRRLWTSWWL